jgi:hypothetical protein
MDQQQWPADGLEPRLHEVATPASLCCSFYSYFREPIRSRVSDRFGAGMDFSPRCGSGRFEFFLGFWVRVCERSTRPAAIPIY